MAMTLNTALANGTFEAGDLFANYYLVLQVGQCNGFYYLTDILSGENYSGDPCSKNHLQVTKYISYHYPCVKITPAKLKSYLKRFCESHITNRENEEAEKIGKLKKLGFEIVKDGFFGYKTFNCEHKAPSSWRIRKGSTLNEECNHDIHEGCGKGINIATLQWCELHYGSFLGVERKIWKCFVDNSWLDGVCIPDNTGGKIRCERIKLIEALPYDHVNRIKIRKKRK